MNRAQRTFPAARFLAVACILLALALPVSAQDTPAAAEDTNQTAGATNGVTNNITISTEGNVAWNGSINAHGDNPIFMIGKDVEVATGETVQAVVVIGGSAKIHGKVNDAVVVIGGSIDVDGGEVGDAVMAILGSATVRGVVHDAAVAILGDVNVPSGEVGNDAVAILGSVNAGKGAKINGDAVAIGGSSDAAHGSTVGGARVGLPIWISKWLKYCVFRLRPLAVQVRWVWVWAGVWFLVYLFVALVLRRPVQACVDDLNRRPATSLLVGILAKILIPFIFLLLVATVIGMVAVPFVFVALLIGSIFGKVALLEWIGLRIGNGTGIKLLQKPLMAFLLGAVLLTLLYLIWVVGLVAFLLFGAWGLGVAITTIFGSVRRENPKPPSPIISPSPYAPMAMPVAAAATGFVATETGSFTMPVEPPIAPAGKEPPHLTVPVPEVLAYPKAGFWLRMAAAFLDVLLVSFSAVFQRPEIVFLVALGYFSLMWWWKGTTIGGIVAGLKVVRFDGQPASYLVMLVRALAAAFSIMIFFLGIFWIGWDRDKQGWHDKIAGTVVLRLPRGTPLLCL